MSIMTGRFLEMRTVEKLDNVQVLLVGCGHA